MIIGIHGRLGSGKTLWLTYLLYKYYKNGYDIFTNYELNQDIIKSKTLNIDELMKYVVYNIKLSDKPMILGFDELQLFLDSRLSMDRQQTVSTYFLFQTRKRQTHVFYSSPMRGLNDIRIREQTNNITYCERIHKSSTNECYIEKCEKEHVFKYTLIDMDSNRKRTILLKNPEFIYSMYDTMELIAPTRFQLSDEDIAKSLK